MSKPLIDPKEVITLATGFVLGLCILVFFVGLSKVLDLTLLVDIGNLPRS
jgi:hypothetical protein